MARSDDDPGRFFHADLVASQAMAEIRARLDDDELPAALELLHELLSEFPRFAPAYDTLGWLYAHPLERPRDAIECYRHALHLDPTYAPTYVHLATVLTSLGELDELPALVERGLAVPGVERARLYHQLGVAFELQRDHHQAARCYTEAIDATLSTEDMEAYERDLARCEAKAARSA